MCESHKNQNQECTGSRSVKSVVDSDQNALIQETAISFFSSSLFVFSDTSEFFLNTKNATTGSTTINTYRRIFSSVRRLSLVPIYEPANAQATAGIASFQRILIDLQIRTVEIRVPDAEDILLVAVQNAPVLLPADRPEAK